MAHRYHRRVDCRGLAVRRVRVLDVYSRLIVGWAMDSHREESLVEAALWMALGRRQPGEELMHHRDSREPVHQSGLSISTGPRSRHENSL